MVIFCLPINKYLGPLDKRSYLYFWTLLSQFIISVIVFPGILKGGNIILSGEITSKY